MGYSCTYSKLADTETNIDHEDLSLLKRNDADRMSTQRRGSSWTFCRLVLILIILFSAATTIFGIAGFVFTRRQVLRFTTTDSMDLPVSTMKREALMVVKDRAKLFVDTILAGTSPEHDLVVSQDEINGFIAQSDYLRGHAFVRIDDTEGTEKAVIELSLPAKGLPGGHGRFFVGSAYVSIEKQEDSKVSTDVLSKLDLAYPVPNLEGPFWEADLAVFRRPGELVVNVKQAQFINWVVPENFLDEKRNLLDCIYESPRDEDEWKRVAKDILAAIESVAFSKGNIVIRAKKGASYQQQNFSGGTNRFLSATSRFGAAPFAWKMD